MKSRLKQLVPLAIRQEIKRQIWRREDRKNPITAERVPPRAETFIGGGDFIYVGDEFFKVLRRHGLTPDMDVLDVGCGQGRMARPLAGFLNNGSYSGFDIVKPGIDWCNEHYADLPNFKFEHVPIYNKRYNKKGHIKASEFVFPYKDDSFDIVFLTSVFTHMFAKDIENYLSEIARVLKPGGKSLITWFILNDQSRAAQNPYYDFAFDYDEVSKTTTPRRPEAAIAFDEDYLKKLYADKNLKISSTEYGFWAKPDSEHEMQDLIIGTKPT